LTTQKLPGTDAARHRTGDADLTIMLAAHQAFRRDLARLVRAAAAADLADPAKRQSVAAGWELFKHELHLHHTAEDELIWPALAAATLGQLPPPLRLLYRALWKPRFNKTPRW
jgi:hemerythrin HHE cation binding domain-containing protein